MLPALRRARIIELLRQEGGASLKEMSEALSASVSTLRRDVDYLCDQGHLDRTHGGAMLNLRGRATLELDSEIASEIERDAKRAIGQHAASLIEPGQSVILDSGTTTTAMARAARDRGIPFTVITNDLAIGAMLSEAAHIQLIVTGGYVRPGTRTLLGADAVQSLQRLHADLAFIGTHALDPEDVSDTSIELAELKRTLISAAATAVLLADSSKIFSRAFCSFGKTSDIRRLITDDRINPDRLATLRQRIAVVDVVGTAP